MVIEEMFLPVPKFGHRRLKNDYGPTIFELSGLIIGLIRLQNTHGRTTENAISPKTQKEPTAVGFMADIYCLGIA